MTSINISIPTDTVGQEKPLKTGVSLRGGFEDEEQLYNIIPTQSFER
jgi:hypothetical protein